MKSAELPPRTYLSLAFTCQSPALTFLSAALTSQSPAFHLPASSSHQQNYSPHLTVSIALLGQFLELPPVQLPPACLNLPRACL